jgi:predicted transcriptional regulator
MESLKVTDHMNRRAVKLQVDMPVAEAVGALLSGKQSGAPVVDAKNKVVGFLSEQDCISQMITSSYYREQVCRVKDIMKSPPLTVKGYDSILELAQTMLKAKPKIYPVIDDNGCLEGSINRSEVLKAIDMHLRDAYKNKGK